MSISFDIFNNEDKKGTNKQINNKWSTWSMIIRKNRVSKVVNAYFHICFAQRETCGKFFC